jgi:glycosyltransferase involved in cell wall biosynthesis
MAADGIGPSHTCVQLVDGMDLAGVPLDLLVNRCRTSVRARQVHAILPHPLSKLPYRFLRGPASQALEKWYLNRLQDGDIAWLWPSVSEKTHDLISRRGNDIVLEGINTRMAVARIVLDAAYDALAAPPAHNITDARIASEEFKLSCATTIFAPSPSVEKALAGTPLADRFIASSYGTQAQNLPPVRKQSTTGPVTFLFCGFACVRKGIHHLLDIWGDMPKDAHLRIVGHIEPLIAERYTNVLNSENVNAVGFTRDVDWHFSTSDVFVFPSLEEGDALVTYQAAAHGLPIISTDAGAGRFGSETGSTATITPTDKDEFLDVLLTHYKSVDLRTSYGAETRSHIAKYDWHKIGAERGALLKKWLAGETPVFPRINSLS